jgi:hypothetical protein
MVLFTAGVLAALVAAFTCPETATGAVSAPLEASRRQYQIGPEAVSREEIAAVSLRNAVRIAGFAAAADGSYLQRNDSPEPPLSSPSEIGDGQYHESESRQERQGLMLRLGLGLGLVYLVFLGCWIWATRVRPRPQRH